MSKSINNFWLYLCVYVFLIYLLYVPDLVNKYPYMYATQSFFSCNWKFVDDTNTYYYFFRMEIFLNLNGCHCDTPQIINSHESFNSIDIQS